MALTKAQSKAFLYLVNKAGTEDLDAIMQAYNDRRKVADQEVKSLVQPGAKVQFTVGKSGKTLRGVVQKINRRTVAVKTADGRGWRVQPEVIQPVAAKSA